MDFRFRGNDVLHLPIDHSLVRSQLDWGVRLTSQVGSRGCVERHSVYRRSTGSG